MLPPAAYPSPCPRQPTRQRCPGTPACGLPLRGPDPRHINRRELPACAYHAPCAPSATHLPAQFGQAVGGGLCGRALLADILDVLTAPLERTADLAARDLAAPEPRFVYYSAHYPTLLCLLSALGISADSGEAADGWLAERLLGEGSVLAFELHAAADGATSVQLWLLDGAEVWSRLRGGGERAWSKREGGLD